MLSKINSAALIGIDAVLVTIEVDPRRGLPKEIIIGLPDAVIKESKNRISSAIKNSQLQYPEKCYIINLGPAELPKEGPFFDLPIAIGILQATNQINIDRDTLCIGELALNGEVKAVRGIIAICQMAKRLNFKRIILPFENAAEASLIPDLQLIPLKALKELPLILEGLAPIPETPTPQIKEKYVDLDLAEVKGQNTAKRAIEIAAAGNHNILFIGPPGSGKTMLLKRLPTILPNMTLDEAIETAKLLSISKKTKQMSSFSFKRPFRNPHHSISYAGLIGGGINPAPGEISLAHNGILFLDELPEFSRQVIEVLRQPMEEKEVSISRANFVVKYPAKFMFAAAMNPCPCGYHNDSKTECQCQSTQIKKYWKKISGPILDRTDIILTIPRLNKDDYFQKQSTSNGYNSKQVKQKVTKTRTIQHERFKSNKLNSEMTPQDLHKHCQISPDMKKCLENAIEKGLLTGRSFDKVLKLSRTIADIENSNEINQSHIYEALQYRRSID